MPKFNAGDICAYDIFLKSGSVVSGTIEVEKETSFSEMNDLMKALFGVDSKNVRLNSSAESIFVADPASVEAVRIYKQSSMKNV